MIAEPSEFAPHFEGCRCGRCPLYPVEFWKKGEARPSPLRRIISQTVSDDGFGYEITKSYECGHTSKFRVLLPAADSDEVGMMAPCGQCGLVPEVGA